jgi:hypothetical protein
MSPPVAMPASAAPSGDIGDVTRMIGGLGNRVAVRRNSGGPRYPDQPHCCCGHYREHHMTHVVSSLFYGARNLTLNLRAVKAGDRLTPCRSSKGGGKRRSVTRALWCKRQSEFGRHHTPWTDIHSSLLLGYSQGHTRST